MKVPLFLLFASSLFAQPVLTLSTTGAVYPGATLAVTVGLTGSSGQNISGLQFGLPAGSSAMLPGAASTAALKTLRTSTAGTTVLLVGWSGSTPPTASNAPYADGVVGTFSYLVPAGMGPLSLALTGPVAASTTGQNVAITTAPLALTVGLDPACASAITTNVGSWTTNPSAAGFVAIVMELAAASTTGTCK